MFLPTTERELRQRGWDECDLIIVTPDAYVDHPSFAMAVLGRFLEKHGYRVGILTQPHWRDPESFLELGVPRIAFAVSGGNVDSMVLNYTPAKKPRNEDAYCENNDPFFSSPGDPNKYRIRPDRAVTVYSNQIRAVSRTTPLIIGGIEASLRRIAHYDYWSNKIRRSILFDAKADLLVYGMGEYPLLEVVEGLEEGTPAGALEIRNTAVIQKSLEGLHDPVILPSFDEVRKETAAFARAFCSFEENGDRRILAQQQDTRYLVQFPKRELTPDELDAIYDVRFERRPHPRFRNIPAYRMIRDSVTAHRGCFGSCAFCTLAAHQGPAIVSRSRESVLREVAEIARQPWFRGTITDIGGPSANMYGSSCRIGGCAHPDCLRRGEACPNLLPAPRAFLDLIRAAETVEGVRHVFVSSGLRYDPCLMDRPLLRELIRRHISGQMKVAPESGSEHVLRVMNKPKTAYFRSFKAQFDEITKAEGIRKYLIPYLIVGHPGEGERELRESLAFLRENRLGGNQFQQFTPTPLTRASAIYYLGFDPCTGVPVEVEKRQGILEERKKKLIDR
jgi:uncharacterized radical SAM protein YgiQ